MGQTQSSIPEIGLRSKARDVAVAFLGVLLAFIVDTHARGESLLPSQFTGIWVEGSCENPDRTRLLNPFGIIDFVDVGGVDHMQFFFIEHVEENGADEVSLQLAAPGTPDRPTLDLALVGGRLDGIWIACTEQPQDLLLAFAEGIAAFHALGDIRAACDTNGRACVDTAWNHADVTGDGSLSRAEIARVVRGFGFFAIYAFHQQALVRADEMSVPMALVPMLARYFVGTVIENSDYNDDGSLTLEELMQDRGDADSAIALLGALGPAGTQAGVAGIVNALQGAAGLLGLFR